MTKQDIVGWILFGAPCTHSLS